MDLSAARRDIQTDPMFASLAEQVKLPLVQIRHAVELLGQDAGQAAKLIDTTALATLRLIDGYLLSVRLQQEGQLQLEPVSVSSLLYDTAEQLKDYAALHHCDIDLVIGGRYEPVMAERRALQAALLALGYGFVGASAATARKRQTLKLVVRRRGGGLSAGVYGRDMIIPKGLLKQARQLQGHRHQALPDFASDSGAGVLIADRLLAQLGSTMQPAKMQGSYGLAALLTPSRQLSLV